MVFTTKINAKRDMTRSSACAFLSVKIADRIIHELGAHISDIASIAEMIEEVNWVLPQKINAKRDMTRFIYDVSEGCSILWKATVLNSQYNFFEELPFSDCNYGFDSRRKLHKRLCVLGQADFTAIFSSVPYILVIACIGGRAFISDNGKRQVTFDVEVSLSLAMEDSSMLVYNRVLANHFLA